MVERFYGHLKPKTLNEAMAKLPRFTGLPLATPDANTGSLSSMRDSSCDTCASSSDGS